MSGEELDPIEALYFTIVERLTKERERLIDELGKGPPDVRGTLRALFPIGATTDEFLGELGPAQRAKEASAKPSESPPPSADAPGNDEAGDSTRLADRYRFITPLGQGGMGTVFLAYDERLHRQVAIKKVNPFLRDSADTRKRFEREAHAASRLDHPNLCRVFEADIDNGTPYLVMQYVEGQSLRAKLTTARNEKIPLLAHVSRKLKGGSSSSTSTTTGPATPAEVMGVVRLIEKLARALHFAHEQGLIHRDIKPGNIMIKPDGEPVVLDFGLVRDETTDDITITRTGDLWGTPSYMSPEQATQSSAQIDSRTDVYSLGVTLFECLTFSLPFRGPTNHEVLERVKLEPTPNPRRINPQIPRDLRIVVETALEKVRDRRYATAHDLAEDLRRVRCHEPIRAKRAGVPIRLWRWTQRNQVAAVLLITLALGISSTVGFAWQSYRQRALARTLDDKLKTVTIQLDLFNLETLLPELEQAYPDSPEMVARLEESIEYLSTLRDELPIYYRELQSLRDRCSMTEAEREETRQTKPDFFELERCRSRLEVLREIRTSKPTAEKAIRMARGTRLTEVSAKGLVSETLKRVSPNPTGRVVHNEALLGLGLVHLALEKINEGDESESSWSAYHVLALAWDANGFESEAVNAARRAMDDAPPTSSFRPLYQKIAGTIENRKETEPQLIERIDDLRHDLEDLQFSSIEDQWQYEIISRLPINVRSLDDNLEDLRRKLIWSRFALRLAHDHSAASARWRDARSAVQQADGNVASEQYGVYPIDLSPQMGLVPIGMNPKTQLWEFYHPRSAWSLTSTDPNDVELPTVEDYDAEGALDENRFPGIVFVLIPGGTFSMGAQRENAQKDNYDPYATSFESPVHEASILPFFMARHEITQGQWMRMSGGENPSTFDFEYVSSFPASSRHPVDSIDWGTSRRFLSKFGLALPSEAQWEYATRAGTTTIWHVGSEESDLHKAANLSEADGWPDDGFPHPSPVGSFPANPWGLFDTMGNYFEWCEDSWYLNHEGALRTDQARVFVASYPHVIRGGASGLDAKAARSARRSPCSQAAFNVSLRPARALQ